MSEHIYPRLNQSYRHRRVALLLAFTLMLLLAGCNPPTPAPTATPNAPTESTSSAPATPAPITSLLPTVTPSSGDPGGDATLPEPLVGLAAGLGTDWSVATLSGDALAAMTGGAGGEPGTVVARYTSAGDDAGAPAFTILMTPRAGLSLDAYLDEVASALAATGGVENGGVTVNEAEIDYSLRTDGVPAALIRFQADGKLFDAAGIVVDGMQAAVLDESAANMIVITLTSDAARADQLQPLLEKIVAVLIQTDATE